jgi:hypothetical protein
MTTGFIRIFVQSTVYRQIKIYCYEAGLKGYSHRIVTLAPPPMSPGGGVPVVLVVKSRSRGQKAALSRTDRSDLAKVSEVSETDLKTALAHSRT